jgi:dTDP-4-dehydrorhamnose reductase
VDESILIIGAKGQLGQALQSKYKNARAVDSDELDITDSEAIERFDWTSIKIILNAAAYTNVDGAETKEGRVSAWQINAKALNNLVRLANAKDITIFHISTDFVFDGSNKMHTEDENFSPLSAYGASKAAGDIVVLGAKKYYILRTSWVVGEGNNFVRTMIELGKKGVSPSVIEDHIGRLTFTHELVKVIGHIIQNKLEYGTYNCSNSGDPSSWADITKSIFEAAGYNLTVTGISNETYYSDKPMSAIRPLNSMLKLNKLESSGFVFSNWRDDLVKYVNKELS